MRDPDAIMWEVYTLEEDLDHCRSGTLPAPTTRQAEGPPPAVWSHRLGQPFPTKLPILEATVDHVVLAPSRRGCHYYTACQRADKELTPSRLGSALFRTLDTRCKPRKEFGFVKKCP